MSLIRSVLITAIGVAAMVFPSTNNAADMQEIPEQAAADRPPPELIIERRNSQLTNTGDVSSTEHEVEQLKIGASLEEQCRQLFASVSGERHIGFKPSSNELTTNAFSLLDEIIQIAADCPSAAITITGHTDNSGDEHTNQPLSKARADSVVAYMVARGISAERLQSHGAGSSVPLSTDDNARARKLNRRIEFEISFPQ